MAVFDNEDQVIVNTNDCPFDIGKTTASIIKSTYGKVDFLLVGYVAASSWPHCYNMTENEKAEQARLKQELLGIESQLRMVADTRAQAELQAASEQLQIDSQLRDMAKDRPRHEEA